MIKKNSNLYEIIQIYISFFLHLIHAHIACLKYINIQYFYCIQHICFIKKSIFFFVIVMKKKK